jgi:hypothetical protein
MWQQQDDGITRTWDDAKNYCENLTVGGYNDWRLPQKKELESIINYGQSSLAIDTSVFSNTKTDNYWSSTTYAACDVSKAWYVHFGSGIDFQDDCTYERSSGGYYSNTTFQGGNINFGYTSAKYYARCVRGGPMSFSDFVDNGNGTVTDQSTGLMWQQDEARNNRGEVSAMKWGNALDYCEGLSLGGYTDWRLPNVRELLSLTDDTKTYPSINTTFFSNVQSDSVCSYGDDQTYFYWTSTTSASTITNKLTVSFERGFTTSHHLRDRDNYVRCVRGGEQSYSLDEREIKIDTMDIDFWYVKTNESKLSSITISNIGKDDLTIGTITAPSSPFSITSDECSGKTLSAITSCTITVQLSSLSEGTFTGILTIPSNDADAPSVAINLSGKVDLSGGTFLLPDTGQLTCYNDAGTAITCPSPGQSLAQDGSYISNPPSYTTNSNGTTTDNNTKLIWQKEDDSTVRTWDEANSYCDSLNLGGYTDWRLPTKRELFSIVDFGRYNPSINTSVFTNTKTDRYWTSSVDSSSNNPWYIYFGKLLIDDSCIYYNSYYKYDGVSVDSIDKSNKYYVRCVRGEQLSDSIFVDNGDDTVTDSSTGLIWQKGDSTYSQTWATALSYCENLTLGGYSDWRLPNIKELQSLSDTYYDSGYSSAFSSESSCSSSNSYWSSTSIRYVTCAAFWAYQEAYLASLSGGLVFSEAKPYSNNYTTWSDNRARCVRGGNTSLDSLKISVSHSSLNFGSVEINNSSSLSFTVSNAGTGNLTINTITTPSSPFSITSDGCSGQTLSSSASCSVTVKFAPTTEGTFTDSITISSNDADNPSVIVTLSGTATLPSAILTGTVTDSSTGLSLSNVTVTLTDSIKTHNTTTDINGGYTISSIAEGSFTAIFEKAGYIKQTVSDTLTAGQTLTLNVQLSPIPSLTISITSPTDGATLTSSPITVTGTVSNNATVTVNNVQATVSNDTFSASVSLTEGQNTITATAVDQYNQTALQSITITLTTKGSITGTVTDSSGLALSSATISVTDSSNTTQTTLTDTNGSYTVSNIASGTFTISITKDGYTSYSYSDTISSGQSIIINATLSPVYPVISSITTSNITTDSATITWTTDQTSDSLVEYGTTTAYGNSVSDSTLTTSHSITLSGLSSETTYYFKITSTNSYGFSTTSGDNTFTTLSPPSSITLTITSPSNGETISKDSVMVKGTITNSTGNETGVTVNGVVATVYGDSFVANNVSLSEGSNTITVTATDTAGNTGTASITVNASTGGDYIKITSNIESGISPLEVTLRIEASFIFTHSDLIVTGPAQPETLSSSAEEYKLKMTTEGTYYITASVTDSNGTTYEDIIAITVLNKTELDNLLKGKWEGMKGALSSQNINDATTYYTEETKQLYSDIFTALYSQLPQLAQDMQNIQIIYAKNNTAKYRIRKDETHGGQTLAVTYYLYFAVDTDGIWKIYRY